MQHAENHKVIPIKEKDIDPVGLKLAKQTLHQHFPNAKIAFTYLNPGSAGVLTTHGTQPFTLVALDAKQEKYALVVGENMHVWDLDYTKHMMSRYPTNEDLINSSKAYTNVKTLKDVKAKAVYQEYKSLWKSAHASKPLPELYIAEGRETVSGPLNLTKRMIILGRKDYEASNLNDLRAALAHEVGHNVRGDTDPKALMESHNNNVRENHLAVARRGVFQQKNEMATDTVALDIMHAERPHEDVKKTLATMLAHFAKRRHGVEVKVKERIDNVNHHHLGELQPTSIPSHAASHHIKR